MTSTNIEKGNYADADYTMCISLTFAEDLIDFHIAK